MGQRKQELETAPSGPGGHEFATFVADLLAPLGPVGMRRLFSGYGFTIDGVPFAMIARGSFYLRADQSLADELSRLGGQPFRYRRQQRTMTIASYYAVPEDRLDEAETLLEWARRAVAVARAAARQARSRPRRD